MSMEKLQEFTAYQKSLALFDLVIEDMIPCGLPKDFIADRTAKCNEIAAIFTATIVKLKQRAAA